MLRRALCATAALALFASAALGQTYKASNGTAVQPSVPLPYPYAPFPGAGQHNLAPTSALALTVPAGATYATVCARSAAANYTTDGETPTASVGQPLSAGACVALIGPAVLAAFRAFSATGTLDVEYFE